MKPTRWNRFGATVSVFALTPAALVAAQAVNSTYIGPAGGSFNSAANWSPQQVPENVGTTTYNVSIPTPGPVLDTATAPTISSLSIGAAGSLSSVDQSLTVLGSTSLGTSVSQSGAINLTSSNAAVTFNLGTLTNLSGGTLSGGNYFVESTGSKTATLQISNASIVTNSASITINGGAQITDQVGDNALAGLTTNTSSGVLNVGTQKYFTNVDMSGPLTNNGTVNIGGPFAPQPNSIFATLTVGPTQNYYQASGTTTIGENGQLDINSQYIQSGGVTDMEGGTLNAGGETTGGSTTGVVINGGSVIGHGTLENAVFASGTTLAPGSASGMGTLTGGGYTLQSGSTTSLAIGGASTGQFDTLTPFITYLGGNLQVSLVNGFVPTDADVFKIVQSTGLFGAFDNVANDARVTTTDGSGSFEVIYSESANSGNFVELTNFQSVPEPSAVAIALFGIGGLVVRRKRCKAH